MIQPSCPAYVIHEADDFRKGLIKSLDQSHFSVTFSADGDEAIRNIEQRQFNVIILGLNVATKVGTKALDFLGKNRERIRCGIIILGEPDPALRTYAPWANETLLKPVDPSYVANRARSYCGC
jgi:DNA-binding response OmpR family regulator